MAINITITGLTTQQQQDVGNAFDQIYPGRIEAGLTKAQWVERNLIRIIKGAVIGMKRRTYEAQLATDQTQVDTDYPEA